MKVWEKIYIGTLVVLLIVLNLCVGTTFYISYHNSLKTEKDTAYSQWNTIKSAMEKDIDAIEKGKRLNEKSLSELFGEYCIKYYSNGLNLELYRSDDIKKTTNVKPYCSYELAKGEKGYTRTKNKYYEMLKMVDDKPKQCVMDENDEKYVSVAGTMKIAKISYVFAIRKELPGFKKIWTRMIYIFTLIEVFASVVLIVVLYFFLKKVLHPLENLTIAADMMASGTLDQEVQVKGKDEIASLTRSFNHMAKEISNTMDQLSEEAKNKQQFIDDLSHELRTPLTTIQGYSQLLQNVILPEEKKRQYLSYMENESKRIQMMSNDLLKLTLMKRESLEFDWFDNEELATNAIEPLRLLANKQRVEIYIETDHKRSYGHKTLLENVLINLIRNAMNACPEGGIITVGINENYFYVKDNGIGMNKECQEKLFEPFYREDKARSRKAFGAGLGMSIVKNIIEKHHGEIKVSSKKGEGTLIEIRLPSKNLTTS